MLLESLNWSEGMYVTLIIWAFAVFVVVYFYKHAFKKYRVGIIPALAIISALFFFILLFLGLRNRHPYNPTRVAIFPFVSTDGQLSWQSLAFSELTSEILKPVEPGRLLAYATEWLTSAANLDSLRFEDYVISFSRRIGLDYVAFGGLEKRGSTLQVDYTIMVPAEDGPRLNRRVEINELEIEAFCHELAQTLIGAIPEVQAALGTIPDLCCPSQIESYFKARHALLSNDFDRAFHLAHEAVEDSNSSLSLNLAAELSIQRGIERRNSNQDGFPYFKRAKTLLLKSDSVRPENAETLRLLGELYLANEKWQKANDYLERSFQINPNLPRTLVALTRLHSSRYQSFGFESKEDILKRAIWINPAFLEARLALAEAHTFKSRLDLARSEIKKALRINPDHIDALMAFGKVCMSQQDWLTVLETYEKVLELDPENADVFYNLGIVHYYQQDFESAIKYFQHAIRLNDHLDSRLYLAYIYEKQGDLDRAVEYLRARIRMRQGEHDRFAEEARKHLFKMMQQQGRIDSLMSPSSNYRSH